MKVPIEFPDEPMPPLLDLVGFDPELMEVKWVQYWKKYIKSCDWIAKRCLEEHLDTIKMLIESVEDDEKAEAPQ